MVGRSPLMLEVFAKIRRIAPHYRTVLVAGPTGSSKELVAMRCIGLVRRLVKFRGLQLFRVG